MSALVLGLTNLFGVAGGIPSFNRLLVQAAVEYVGARRGARQLKVIVLMDDAAGRPEGFLADCGAGAYLPCGGDRRRFLATLLLQVPRRPALCLGHVNLAPAGLPFVPGGRGFGVVAHGTEVWRPLPLVRRLSLRRARAVACVSDHTARSVAEQQGVSPDRCVRIINALDAERFDAILPSGPEGREPATGDPVGRASRDAGDPLDSAQDVGILSITRLHPGEPKGIDLVVRALTGLPEVHYTVAGEGDDLPRLRTLAAELGVADRVHFLGRVSDAERARLLRQCAVFALPSSGEGFGIVYLEAMAHARPCIAANVGGAPEVVIDGETGLLVPPAVAPLQQALVALLADPARRLSLGQAGQRRAREHFRYPHFRDKAYRFFDLLTAETRGFALGAFSGGAVA